MKLLHFNPKTLLQCTTQLYTVHSRCAMCLTCNANVVLFLFETCFKLIVITDFSEQKSSKPTNDLPWTITSSILFPSFSEPLLHDKYYLIKINLSHSMTTSYNNLFRNIHHSFSIGRWKTRKENPFIYRLYRCQITKNASRCTSVKSGFWTHF